MTVYGAPWCPHCKRVKKFLAAHRVRYAFVDIDTDPQAIARLKELQDGGQIIPTVVYPDGTHEVNPSDEALGWWRGSPHDAMNRVRQGPPALTRHQP